MSVRGLLREDPVQVAKGLEFQGVAGGVQEEHGRLFPDLAGETNTRLDDKRGLRLAEPICQLVPVIPGEDHAEVTDGNGLAVDLIACGGGRLWGGKVGDYLMAVEVEVHPAFTAPALSASEEAAVECPGLLQIVNGKGQVERRNHFGALPRLISRQPCGP